MAEVGKNTETKTDAPKKRKAQGPRKPQPFYVFGSVTDADGNVIPNAKFNVTKVTKNAHDIAKWVSDGGATSGVSLLTIEAPAADKPTTEQAPATVA